MTTYSRLPHEPQRKGPVIDIYPETQEESSKSGFSSYYFDEFLSAIKIFGYLERPVFHELTRSMQTRKLIAGETLNLEEEKGFCLVVDGLVKIFVKSSRKLEEQNSDSYDSCDSADDRQKKGAQQGYQLLTEVSNGSPMSSLFSILSLFTEDVKLRHSAEDEIENSPSRVNNNFSSSSDPLCPNIHNPAQPPKDYSLYSSQITSVDSTQRNRRSYSVTSSPAFGTLPRVIPLSLNHVEAEKENHPKIRRNQKNSAHPDLLARATIDTTIAIIPASAFRRLTRIYPKATAYIVQVILTRLQRVTLATGHSYLGLTAEVLRTEKYMNKYITYKLPEYERNVALERLKEKFMREKERIGNEESSKGIALHNPRRRRRKDANLCNEVSVQALVRKEVPNLSDPNLDLSGSCEGGASPSPGDLLTNIHSSRKAGRLYKPPSPNQGISSFPPRQLKTGSHERIPPNSLLARSLRPNVNSLNAQIALNREDSKDEDGKFRVSVLECILKAIGLTNTKNVFQVAGSLESSPTLVSYDQKRQKAVFSSNAFGIMEAFEGSVDGETEPTTQSNYHGSFSGHQNMADDLRDELEIVYFPKGSVLVEHGERNPGLYYVIDGILDVTVPNDDVNDSPVLGPTSKMSGAKHAEDKTNSVSRLKYGSSRSSINVLGDNKKRKATLRKSLTCIKPGGIAGYIGTISSYRSLTDVVAKTDVYVGFLPRSSLEMIVEKYPVVLLTMAKRLTSLLPRLLLHIDFALEWVQVSAGQVIYHQDDESDAIYIVLNGRLRLVLNNEKDGMKVMGEFGQGESIGELEVMMESPRPATLHAIRDTELAKFPKTLFNSLAQENPGITIKISKIIASRIRALSDDPVFIQNRKEMHSVKNPKAFSTLNLRTVTVLPVTAGVPVVEFASRLINALTQVGAINGVTLLNQSAILNHLGRHAFSRMGKLKLSQYLADLEDKFGLVLYVAGM